MCALCAPDYSCVSKRARCIFRQPCKGRITDQVIDSTGLKVFGEGEWKVRKHGAEKRRVWRKLHLAVDPATHAIVTAEVSLENVHDAEVLPTLLNLLRRKLGLTHWKPQFGYHRRSLAETAMYRFKQLLAGKISLCNYNAQAGEVMTCWLIWVAITQQYCSIFMGI